MIGKLATKIAAASNDVGGKLNPDKRNQDQKYDYVSADKILAVCGQALATQGVVVFPGITKSEIVMTERTGKSSRYDATIELGITVTDGETEYACAWIGLGSDYMTPDKALYKAVTSGHKYFLMKLLNVGAGNEDGEHEAPEQPRQHKEGQPEQRRPQLPTEHPKPAQPSNGQQAQATNGKRDDESGLPFVNTKRAAVDWAMQHAPGVWPTDKGFIVRQVVERSFDNCAKTTGLTGDALGHAWIVKVNGKIADSQKPVLFPVIDPPTDEDVIDTDPVTAGDWLDG